MIIPLTIGKNSSGQDQIIDLADIFILMISYSEENQLNSLMKKFFCGHNLIQEHNYFIIHSKKRKLWYFNSDKHFTFFRDSPEDGSVNSRKKILNKILAEIKNREKKLNTTEFKNYLETNISNKNKISYRFLIIDDIWDIVRAKPKNICLDFFRILLNGPAVGIHTIIASSLSYRNLLQQLVTIHPVISKELEKKYGIPVPRQINMLGEELIFTHEEMVYYKKTNIANMERFFKL